eukprot:m.148475 g.148475  ORF g.148475 m.148475 type:complete len:735 (-) comp30599_c1_seq1:15-2219(-)
MSWLSYGEHSKSTPCQLNVAYVHQSSTTCVRREPRLGFNNSRIYSPFPFFQHFSGSTSINMDREDGILDGITMVEPPSACQHPSYPFTDTYPVPCTQTPCSEPTNNTQSSPSSSVQKKKLGKQQSKKPLVVIIGAGIAGLGALSFLKDSRHAKLFDVVVVEAQNRCGGRINSTKFTHHDQPLNLGANFLHGCDPDGGNAVYNYFQEHDLPGLVDVCMGNEMYINEHGKPINENIVEQLKLVYSKVDQKMLQRARALKEEGGPDEPWGDIFDQELKRVLARRKRKTTLSIQETAVLDFIKRNQHTYSAEASKLSTTDLADIFKAGSLGGGEKLTMNGFGVITDHIASKHAKNIRRQCQVSNVTRLGDNQGCVVHINNESGTPEEIHCHSVICTLPLGVLKAGVVKFDPPLADSKQEAIQKLAMGLENRIAVQFHKLFWPNHINFFRCTKFPQFKIFNLHSSGAHPNTLLFFIPPPFSDDMEGERDETILNDVIACVQTAFNLDEPPLVVAYEITRWRANEYARGSYSYVPVGASVENVKALGAPCARLAFAGEALSTTDMSMTQGAMETGYKAAKYIYDLLLFRTAAIHPRISQTRVHLLTTWREHNPFETKMSKNDLMYFAKKCDTSTKMIQDWVVRCVAQPSSSSKTSTSLSSTRRLTRNSAETATVTVGSTTRGLKRSGARPSLRSPCPGQLPSQPSPSPAARMSKRDRITPSHSDKRKRQKRSGVHNNSKR